MLDFMMAAYRLELPPLAFSVIVCVAQKAADPSASMPDIDGWEYKQLSRHLDCVLSHGNLLLFSGIALSLKDLRILSISHSAVRCNV